MNFSFQAAAPFPLLDGSPNQGNLSIYDPSSILNPLPPISFAGPLSFGTTVDSSLSFDSVWETTSSFLGQTYFGFEVIQSSGISPLYGWVLLDGYYGNEGNFVFSQFGSDISYAAVYHYAYDTTGAPISVGQTTAVPEPTVFNMTLAVTLMGGFYYAYRRRKQESAL